MLLCRMIATGMFDPPGDATAPTVAITSTASTVTPGAFTVTITFSEVVVGFDASKITVANGSAGAVAGTGPYTSVITPTATGTVTVQVAAGAVTDAAGNANTASNAFSILYIAASLWLRSTVGLFQDAGTTPATADADPVGQWTDQSASHNNASAAAGARPLLENAAGDLIGTLPVIQWFGTDDVMSLGSGITLNDFTLFKIAKYNATYSGLWGNSNANHGIYRADTNTKMRFRYNTATNYDLTLTSNVLLNTAYVVLVIRSGTTTTVRANGAQIGTFGAGDYVNAGTAWTINRLGLAIGSFGQLSIAEAGVIPAAVSGASLTALEAYLSTRSGISF